MSENKKPRLCEVLGVEVNERFDIDAHGMERNFFIGEDGEAHSEYNEETTSRLILEAINNPDKIIRKTRKPHLTEPELAICKAAGAKWVSKSICEYAEILNLWERKPIIDADGIFCPSSEDEVAIGYMIFPEMFLSVKPGDCIRVEE